MSSTHGFTPAGRSSSQQVRPVSLGISTGAGIAIAGVWLAASAQTIVLLLITFVWSAPVRPSAAVEIQATVEQMSALMALFTLLGIVLILGSPLIAAYSVTKLILNKI